MLRYLLKGIGASGHAGEDLLSYLAFEPIYLQRVMEVGYADTIARRDEIEEFFSAAASAGAGQPARRRGDAPRPRPSLARPAGSIPRRACADRAA